MKQNLIDRMKEAWDKHHFPGVKLSEQAIHGRWVVFYRNCTRSQRFSYWTAKDHACAHGGTVAHVGPQEGYLPQRVWKRIMDFCPIQRCHECGRLYWADMPRFSREWVGDDPNENFVAGTNTRKAWVVRWLPGWSDHCSRICADQEIERLSNEV